MTPTKILSGRQKQSYRGEIMKWVYLATFSILVLCGCADAPPPIGSDLHGPVNEVALAFEQRVKKQFPVGSDESVLRADLMREKFAIRRD